MALLSEKPRGFASDTSSLTLTLVILGKFYITNLYQGHQSLLGAPQGLASTPEPNCGSLDSHFPVVSSQTVN